MGKISFRQIHLDFHTGEKIPGVGNKFDKKQFQDALIKGHVGSISIFAKCHHGWLYYFDGISDSHPNLKTNLLENMLEACREIDVRTQIYISAGLDEMMAKKHPEWLFRNKDQSTSWVKDFTVAGYHELCMNTPYLDYLLSQVKEVVERYDTDGIFLDIVGVHKCYCQTCMNQLINEGKDPRDDNAVIELGERVFKNYMQKIEETIHSVKPHMRIFHNSGHMEKGRRDLFRYCTHFELESLPTGGWGYDHFPLSARYIQGLGKDFLGMTGKFHTTWGEFGGFKHPNALRYESALNLANGAKTSIGDQMHPQGILDEVTYGLIGEAYKEVEEKEAWCDDVEAIADIGLLTQECIEIKDRDNASRIIGKSDLGAVRMLLEENYLFNVIDTEEDFNKYKVIILPDVVLLDANLENKLKDYIAEGGKVLATGQSGLDRNEERFVLDLGVNYEGKNPYKPDYFVPQFSYRGLGSTSFIMYGDGIKISLDKGEVIGEREDPYFNRDLLHFSSHFHTPNEPGKRSPGIVKSDSGIYIAWNVFNDYAIKGHLILRDTVKYALDELLGASKTLKTNLKAQGVTTIQHQKEQRRLIHHLLYAVPVKRGENVEIIEDIVPIYDVQVELQAEEKIKRVYLAPQMKDIEFNQENNKITYIVEKVDCHQMIVLEY